MIPSLSLSISRAVLATALGSFGVPSILTAAETIVIRDAPTNEQMVMQIHKAQLAASQNTVKEAPVSQDVSKMSKPVSLMDRSTILSFGGKLTLVPKGAIMEYSEKYADRLTKSPGAQVVDFPIFAAANRGWLSTYEVSFEQARGRVPVDPEAKALMKKSGNVVVATFRGSPIQIMPPVPAADATVGNQPQTPNPQP